MRDIHLEYGTIYRVGSLRPLPLLSRGASTAAPDYLSLPYKGQEVAVKRQDAQG